MIDEGILINALHDVADSFEVSKEATNRILIEAGDSSPESPPSRGVAFLRTPSRSRTILAAAAAVLVIGGISLPLLRHEGGAPATYAAKKFVLGGRPPTVAGTGFVGGLYANNGAAQGPATSSHLGSVVATATPSAPGVAGVGPRIESSGSVDLRVKGGGVEVSFAKLSALASRDGGSVISSQAQVGNRPSGHFALGTIVLQVPQRNFSKLVIEVQGVGHATSIDTTSTDVTGQYVDLRARITAEQASRRQYLTIMTRAGSINDILSVQRQLDAIQSQIEQLQGQLNVLNSQTTYGSLTVNLTTATQPTNVVHPRSGLSKAWHDAIGGFVAGVEWVIRISGPVLFAVLALGVLLALGRFAWRATRRRRV
jgi:hypothetical protein